MALPPAGTGRPHCGPILIVPGPEPGVQHTPQTGECRDLPQWSAGKANLRPLLRADRQRFVRYDGAGCCCYKGMLADLNGIRAVEHEVRSGPRRFLVILENGKPPEWALSRSSSSMSAIADSRDVDESADLVATNGCQETEGCQMLGPASPLPSWIGWGREQSIDIPKSITYILGC